MSQEIRIVRKNVRNKNFLFSRGKTDLAKINPPPQSLGVGVTLKFQIGTPIFYCRFGFSIKKYISLIRKIFFDSRQMAL